MQKTLDSLHDAAIERTLRSLHEFEGFSQKFTKWCAHAFKKKKIDLDVFGTLAVNVAEFFAKSVEINGMLLEAILSLTMYVKSLKAYSSELDEAWDELLERSRKAQEQAQAVQREIKKKPSYRV